MPVREFLEKDRESLRSVYLVTRRERFCWLNGESLRESDFDRDTEGEKIWVFESAGKVIGFISVWEPENFIHHLFVLPAFSRLGYGSQLLKVCMAKIGRPAQLKCVSQNTVALKFYQSKGWYKVSKGVSSDGDYHLMETNES